MEYSRFFTRVEDEASAHDSAPWMGYAERCWTLGSCFADEIGARMRRRLLPVRVNPCGALYNPMSIAATLCRIADGKQYDASELFEHEGLWRSLDFHSSLSHPDRVEALSLINGRMAALHEELPGLTRLILTLGSAHLFEDAESGRVVANCHKLPARRFTERDAGIEEMTEALTEAVERLRMVAPGLEVMVTVSPIRHKAYGYHRDKLSKAALLLTADNLTRSIGARYFPSYEIMQDELRDYRFYASDMIHPSETACDYIFSRWEEACVSEADRKCGEECLKLHARCAHRFGEHTPADVRMEFAQKTRELAGRIATRWPQAADVIDDYLNQI